jgi:hypothetical protein
MTTSDRENDTADRDLGERIRTLERQRFRALVKAEVDVAAPLHADDFQLINPFGMTLTKSEYLGGIASGEINYLVFEPVGVIAVHVFDGAVAIRYRSRLEIIVGGRHLPPGHYWHTDLYAQRGGRWQVVWSQATEIRDQS